MNNLTASTGALFVVAAGNDGPDPQTLQTPAVADAALTVATSHESDVINPIARFSSRGPRADGVLKPDNASGTSMATPHVAGAAAILAQQHPDWTAEQLKTTLMSTSLGLTTLFGNLPPPTGHLHQRPTP